MEKKALFSGIQPSGIIHLGNYLGAIKQWIELQNEYKSYFCIVDLHALTAYQKPEELRKNIVQTAKIFLASGINPEKSVIFAQSDVSQHSELYWILNTITKVPELELMTQYKDKIQKQKSLLAGLLNYPVLMAADILLYNTNSVPVGEDQRQHIELTRELARRFNETYGETFVIPQPLIGKIGAKIMALDNPQKKMSKSDGKESYIAVTDTPKEIENKIKRAVTDSGSEIKYDLRNKPGISNLLIIYSLLSGKEIKEIEKEFKEKNYGDFKKATAQEIISFLTPFQKKLSSLSDDKIISILKDGARKAEEVAEKKIEEVYKKVGLR